MLKFLKSWWNFVSTFLPFQLSFIKCFNKQKPSCIFTHLLPLSTSHGKWTRQPNWVGISWLISMYWFLRLLIRPHLLLSGNSCIHKKLTAWIYFCSPELENVLWIQCCRMRCPWSKFMPKPSNRYLWQKLYWKVNWSLITNRTIVNRE